MIRRLLLLFILLGQPPLLFAQFGLPESPPERVDEPEIVVPLQDLDAERTRVESHIADATKQLTDATAALDASAVPGGVEDQESLQRRVNLLRDRVQIGRRHLKVVADALAFRDERRRLEAEVNSWTGLAESPPYPLPLVQELAKRLKSQEALIAAGQMRLESSARTKALAADELTSAEKQFRQTLEALEAAVGDEAKEQARQQHALSQLALTANGEAVAFIRSREQGLRERLTLDRLRAEFAAKQLRVALADVRLTQAEVETRVASLGKDLAALNHSGAKLGESEAIAAGELAVVRGRLAAEKEKGDSDPLHTLDLDLRQEQLDTLRATMEDINLHIGYVQLQQNAWKSWLDLKQHWDFAKAKTQLKEIETIRPVIEGGIAQFERARGEVEDFAIESRFAGPALTVPRNALIAAMQERRTQLAATLRSALQLRDFFELWKREIEVRLGDLGADQQVRGWGEVFNEYFKRIWNLEVLSVEDTLVVDGARMIEQRPVTIGKVIEAVLILAIGLLVASGLARLISRILLPFAGRRWQRRLLLQKVLRVGMIALVVVLALVTVKIPLTVFAFLGGAIALGIGFGAKNLINNFLSGFILLGEGTIRVGDRIQIEGTGGIVEKIGERSTRVRRFDGVDLLIPNSQFLESSVTNMTLSDQRIRVSIQVGVAYGSPTRQVHQLLLEIARSQELVVPDPVPVVVFEDFGDSALIFRLYVWIDFAAQKDHRAVVTELRHRIAERFADQGYAMAFPQRDLHLDAQDPIRIQVLPSASAVGTDDGVGG